MTKIVTPKVQKKIAMNHNETVLAVVVNKKIAMNHNETILRIGK